MTPLQSMSLHAVKEEDPTVRAKLLNRISAETIKSVVREFAGMSHTAGSDNDLKLAVQVKNFLEAHNFSKVEMKDYNVLLSLPDDTEPNHFDIVDQTSNKTVYSSLEDSAKGQSKWSAYCAYSPKADLKVWPSVRFVTTELNIYRVIPESGHIRQLWTGG